MIGQVLKKGLPRTEFTTLKTALSRQSYGKHVERGDGETWGCGATTVEHYVSSVSIWTYDSISSRRSGSPPLRRQIAAT
jgi:hypothetical protein